MDEEVLAACQSFATLGGDIFSSNNVSLDVVCTSKHFKHVNRAFPGGPVVKLPPCSVGDEGSILYWEINIPYSTE